MLLTDERVPPRQFESEKETFQCPAYWLTVAFAIFPVTERDCQTFTLTGPEGNLTRLGRAVL